MRNPLAFHTTNTFAQGCAGGVGIHISKAPIVVDWCTVSKNPSKCRFFLLLRKITHTIGKLYDKPYTTYFMIFAICKVTFSSGKEHNFSWQIKESLGKCWKCNKRCCRPGPFLTAGCRFLRIFFSDTLC